MTRPFCVIGFTMLFTLFVMSAQNEQAMGAVFAAALIAFVVSLAIPKTRRDQTLPTAFFSVLLSLVLLSQANIAYRQITSVPENSVTVTGELADLPYSDNGRQYLILHVTSVNGEPADFRLRLASRTPVDIAPLDRVTTEMQLFQLGAQTGDSGIAEYYRAKDLTVGAYATGEVTVTRNVRTDPAGLILQFRKALLDTILTVLPNDTGAVIAGLSLGANTYIPESVKNAFRASGISHLLVVSGLHLSTWTLYLYRMLGKLRLHRRFRAGINIAFVVFFVFLTGGAPSVVRAAVMTGTVFAAELFRREAEPMNSVGLALTGMLIANPYAARSLSLLLSVFATVGILLLAKPIETALNRLIGNTKHLFARGYRLIVSVISVTAAVTVFTLPVQIWAFGTLSLAALPANLLSLTAGSLCMVTGTLGALLALIHLSAFGHGLLLISASLARFLLRVTDWFAAQKFTILPLTSNYATLLLAIALLTAAGFLLIRTPKKHCMRFAAGALAAVFLICNITIFALSESALQMTVCDVGSGTAIVLRYRGETILLSSDGAYYADSEICAILSSYGATHIDTLILPTASESALTAALSVGTQLPVDAVYYASGVKPETLSVGADRIQIDHTVLPFADEKGSVAVQSAGGYSYAQIQFGRFSALISFADTNDFKGGTSTILICGGSLPKGVKSSDFALTILSTDDAAAADFASAQSSTVCTTAENGSIALMIRQDGTFQTTRRS